MRIRLNATSCVSNYLRFFHRCLLTPASFIHFETMAAVVNITSSSDSSIDFLPIPRSRIVIFGLLTALLIPSFLCFTYLFYQFARRQELRRKPSNLIIICLLIVNFVQAITELLMTLSFLKLDHAAITSDWFCQLWMLFEPSFSFGGLWLMAVGSVERYLFIFHGNVLKRYPFMLRYLPIAWCFLQPACLTGALIFFPPGCANTFYPQYFSCGGACFVFDRMNEGVVLNLNTVAPVIIIIVANLVLIIQVLRQKRRMQSAHVWSKNSRMFTQLLFVAGLHNACWLPVAIVWQIDRYTAEKSASLETAISEYLIFFQYLIVTLCPFFYLAGLKELHGPIRAIFLRNRVRVYPTAQARTHAGVVPFTLAPNLR